MKKTSVKRRVFDIIQIGNQNDTASHVFDIFLVCVIILNITAMFLETFDELRAWHGVFNVVETVTVLVFCVEYILRIWTAEYLFPGESRGRAVWKFLRSYDGVIDLLTILPFFFLSGFVEQYTKMQQETPALTGELTTLTIGVDSAWQDRAVKDIEEEYHIDIVLIKRKGKVSAAKAHYVVKVGDQVAYL